MKAAIAGKPDEQFPDNGPDSTLLKAAAAPPAKPGSMQPAPTPAARLLKPPRRPSTLQASPRSNESFRATRPAGSRKSRCRRPFRHVKVWSIFLQKAESQREVNPR